MYSCFTPTSLFRKKIRIFLPTQDFVYNIGQGRRRKNIHIGLGLGYTCATVQRMGSFMYFVLLTSSLLGQIEGYDMSLNGNAVRNQPLEIYMNIGTINTVVGLTRPDGSSAGTCFAPIGGVSGGCSPGLTQDLTNGITTFNISSVSRAADQGVWTSQHGGAENGTINIAVLTVPTSVAVSQTISSLKLSDGTINEQTLTVIVACAYPDVSLVLEYVPKGGGGSTISAASSTSTCTSTGNTGCSDTDANSYTCTITPQYEAGHVSETTYNIQVTVNLDGQYQSIGLNDTITDTDITVQANPDPNPDCPCTGETVLLSLGIAIMCMVLMHAWLVFLFTKGIIKWNIPTVSKCDNEKSPVNIIVVTIAISLCCVVGMVLCAVGMSICQKCTSSDDNTGLILAIVGFVLVVVGLVVDILYVCIFQKKTGHGEVAQVNKGELDENKTNATDDEKDGLLKDGQTSKAEELSGKEDEQNVKKDEQNTKEDEKNRKGEEEKGKTDKTEEQNGKDDEQVEKKIEQDGEKVDETGKKDDQSGKKDEQPGKNEHNIIRASPKEKETHKDGDPV